MHFYQECNIVSVEELTRVSFIKLRNIFCDNVQLQDMSNKRRAHGAFAQAICEVYDWDSTAECSRNVEILANNLLRLLLEALGLKTDRLKKIKCLKDHQLHCHYYPTCSKQNFGRWIPHNPTSNSNSRWTTSFTSTYLGGDLQIFKKMNRDHHDFGIVSI